MKKLNKSLREKSMRLSKKLLFRISLIVLLSVSIQSFSKESVPAYYIKKTELDKTLKKTEAIFVFNFNDDVGIIKNSVIKYAYNGINKTEKTDAFGKITLKVKPGKYVFQFFYTKNFYEIKTEAIAIQPAFRSEMEVNFTSSVNPVPVDKPVIYLYSPQNIDVEIKLGVKGKLGFTYPNYENGWNITTAADGAIKMNDKKYHYLFWDGTFNFTANDLNTNEGFVVEKENLITFFEDKLSKMGLNSKEIEDYITYWYPLMNVNEKNYIHFMFNETYNEYANLTVTPKPDNQFRVFMLWNKAAENSVVKEQTIPSFTRTGFTLVEWGGAKAAALQDVLVK